MAKIWFKVVAALLFAGLNIGLLFPWGVSIDDTIVVLVTIAYMVSLFPYFMYLIINNITADIDVQLEKYNNE